MRTISALEVRAKFGQVLDEAAAGERFIVERAGSPVAAIVPMSDLHAVDPAQIAARRRDAMERVVRHGLRYRRLYGEPTESGADLVRRDRDTGHR